MTINLRIKCRGRGSLVRRAVVVALLLINGTALITVPSVSGKAGQRPVKNSDLIIGLLELPGVLMPRQKDVVAGAELPAHQPLVAYLKRSTASPIVALLKGSGDVETKEDPYKRSCAVVYNALSSWYLIGIKPHGRQQKAWVYVEDSNAFTGLDSLMLLADASGYVTPEWDGELWTTPENRSRVRLLDRSITHDITVVETRGHFEELWLHVEFTERTPCDWKELPPVVAKGWIPAYNKSGKLQLWFYPRLDC